MKKLPLLITILLPLIVVSQNYKVVSNVLPAYYISDYGFNSYANIKTFAIDSMSAGESDTLFYTFKAILDMGDSGWGACVDSSAGSVMGKKLLQQPDRTILFNYSEDSIFIYQNTNTGDKWTYFKYDNGDYLEAHHIKTDYIEVLETYDSVKIFELTHRDNEGNPVEDEINGYEILLGQMMGLIQSFDSYVFPGEFLSCSLLGFENPKMGMQNVNARVAYDYQTGDEFHFYKEDLYWYFDMEDTLYKIDHGQKRWVIRYVNQRTDYQDSVIFEYLECSRNFNYSNNEYDTVYLTETILETIIYDSVLPGILDAYSNQKIEMDEWGGGVYYEIVQHQSSNYNFRPRKGIIEAAYMDYDSCVVRSLFDPCCYGERFIDGCGGPYFSWSDWFGTTIECDLLYFNKNGDKWGEPIAEDCEDLLSDITESVSPKRLCLIYPNPFSDIINVESINNNQSLRLIRLYDINGVLIDSYETDAGKFQMNVRGLPKGFYVIELIFRDNIILREKIIKN